MKSAFVKFAGALTIGLLVLSFTFINSFVPLPTANAATTMPGGFFGPGMRGIQALEQAFTVLRSTVSGFAQSFTSAHITTQQLCVADRSGAQTCVTKSEIDTLLAGGSNGAQVQISAPTQPTISGTTTPPSITITGDNPAIVHVGDTYVDPGAIVTDSQGHDLGYKTFLDGALVSNIVVDTSQVATDTIDYVATDTWGNTVTSTRMVIIEVASSSPSI